ncbi:hypothetical protein BROUX41_002533 [Berkeleyomyces rouxiae]|uniref:uncharacterized protein n=1 Tax=Berkeleyomyces rouxiae TaxID=2035830 RepID=UPI003B7ED887
MSSSLLLALAALGSIVLLKGLFSASRFIQLHFIPPRRPLSAYKRSRRPAYALITGSSAGIGLGTAHALAQQGFGVILLSHMRDELAEAREFIQKRVPGAQVETIELDAITASPAAIARLAANLAARDFAMSVLVNNVGGMPIGGAPFRMFRTYAASDIDNIMAMNARFMAQLTACMIPLLCTHRSGPAERSLVLSLTSAGAVGLPYMTMYSATKAFDMGLACGLAREFAIDPEFAHIDSLVVMPGDVRSQGNCLGVAAGAPNWDIYGRFIVQTVDAAIRQKRRVLVPYWLHHVQIRAMDFTPEEILTREVTKVAVKKRDAFNARYEQRRVADME